MTTHTPGSEAELAEVIRDAAARQAPLTIEGGGTRSGLGRPLQTEATLTTRGLAGLTLYQPEEMVMAARAGTPLTEVRAALAAEGQRLPFEPMDHRTLFGTGGEPTIGAVAAGNISGPRRIAVGAARDFLIGVRFVNGRGELVRNGGRVMKNVTGLDLVKLMAGAFGTLGVLTDVTFKVLPTPPAATTLVFEGLDDVAAVTLLCRAMGTPYEVMGAAHLPAGLQMPGGESTEPAPARTLLRLEGFPEQVDYRFDRIAKSLGAGAAPLRIEGEAHEALWTAVRDAAWLAEPRDAPIWRLSVPPRRGAEVVDAIRSHGEGEVRAFYDWSGGLIWLAVDPVLADAGATLIREVASAVRGHALLVRAAAEVRGRVGVFDPESPARAKLTAAIKASFDPGRLLNPSLMYPAV